MAFLIGVIAFLCFILVLVVVFGLGSFFGYTVLKPLIKAAQNRKAKLRFYTSDFFSLTFVLSLSALYVSTLRETSIPQGVLVTIAVIIFLLTVWMWVRGATKLSLLNISSSWKRFVFLAVLVPVAMLGSAIGIPFLLAATMATLVDQRWGEFLLAACGVVAAPLVALFGQRICAWVIQPDQGNASGSEQEDDLFSTANIELKDSSLPLDD